MLKPKNLAVIGLILILVLITVTKSFWLQTTNYSNIILYKIDQQTETVRMSRLLNNAMKQIGQMSCKLSGTSVSKNGGWCAEISGPNSKQHAFDEPLANELAIFFSGKRVASFGDGPGAYKQYLDSKGSLKCYDAYDGAPFVDSTTNNRVKFLDLSVPIYHLEQYDWVISLEVAEHIPAEFEAIYVDNLVRHAKEGIVLSWAKIGQGGHSHVNNRDFEYVKAKMESLGFSHDAKWSARLKEKASLYWLQDNINVYRRYFS